MGMAFRGFGGFDPVQAGGFAPVAAPNNPRPRSPWAQVPSFDPLSAGGVGPATLPDIDLTLPPAAPAKQGFFGHGGTGRMIAGHLGDALLRATGGQAVFAPAMLAQQQRQRTLADEQRQRTERFQDWRAQQDYSREHPDDQFTSSIVAAGIDPRSPEGVRLYRQRAESMAAPPLMAVDGFDAQNNPTKTFIPRTQLAGGSAPGSAGPVVGTVRNGYRFAGGNPNDRASWVPVGGASPGGGATFR